MKTFKFFSSISQALVLCLAFATGVQALGGNFLQGLGIAGAGTALVTLTRPSTDSALYQGIFKEVWTGEVIRKIGILEGFAWVNTIKMDYSKYVSVINDEAQVIHLASFPAQPDVLINNTTYPIPVQALSTSDVPISLNKFQTKVTEVPDDEFFANTTKPMELHASAHSTSVLENKFALGAWNIAPASNSAAMPVLTASGADDGTGRKMLTWADVMRFKRALDNAVPKISAAPGTRILCLTQDHENDLASVDNTFKDKYYDWATGKPYSALGFTFYPAVNAPYFNFTTLAKQSFGVTPTNAMRQATVFFSTERVAKATGTTTVYLTPKTAETQKNTMAVRHYHLITRLMNEGAGAIVSPNA